MRKIIQAFLGMLFLFVIQNGYSFNLQKHPISKPAVLIADSAKILVRHFNNDALLQYSKSPDFKYDEKSYNGLSIWSRFWHWVWYWVGKLFYQLFGGNISWRVFGYLLLAIFVAFLVYIIFKVLGIDIIKLLRGESAKIDIPCSESLENIHQINFDDEIEKAVSNKNYRLAVRLLYLRSLKQLSDQQLIHWQIEKTNLVYVNELTDPQLRQSFSVLTTQFEYAWYGDFSLDGRSFQNINLMFQHFKQGVQ